MTEAARVGDIIGHSHALAGMIAGTLVGGLIAAAGAVAAGALFVAGLAASCIGVGVLLIGASPLPRRNGGNEPRSRRRVRPPSGPA